MAKTMKSRSVSSQRERQTNVNENGIVRVPFDPSMKMGAASRKRLEKLRGIRDEDIDYSDAPALPDEAWKHAIRNPFMKAYKEQVTIRVDKDVLEWLKSYGAGYQTRLNQILTDAMLKDARKTSGKSVSKESLKRKAS
jgi:uncharacterized protein (DUF4415 family)